MAAPKGDYTPTRGPFKGQTFHGASGTTEAYNKYEKAKAQSIGFTGRAQQKKATASPSYAVAQRKWERELGHKPTRAEKDQIQEALADLSKMNKQARVDKSPNGKLARTLVKLKFRDPKSQRQVGDS